MILEIVGCLLVGLLSLWFYRYQYYYRYLKSIPAPRVWPLLGNVLQFRNVDETLETITLWMNKLKTQTLRIHLPFDAMLSTKDYKLVEHILSSSTLLDKGFQYAFFLPWLGNSLFLSSGQQWRKQRKMITPSFHFQILEQFLDVFNSNAAILVTRFREQVGQPSIDVFPYLTLCTLDIICETAMGTKINAQLEETSEYVQAVNRIARIIPERCVNPLYQVDWIYRFTSLCQEEQQCLKVLHGHTDRVIQNRRQQLAEHGGKIENLEIDDLGRKKRMPFLDMLFQGTIDGKPLTNQEIRNEVSTFMFGGHDTTATALAYALFCIATHPDVQQKAFEEVQQLCGDDPQSPCTFEDIQEMKYMELVIKETLRLYPSAPFITRKSLEDFTFDGVTYPKDMTIGVFVYGIQRDAQNFPNPDMFEPERFTRENYNGRKPFCFIPFSAGPRNCIGQKFAMIEMKAILSCILRHFVLKPATPEHTLHLVAESILKATNGVMIAFEPRKY